MTKIIVIGIQSLVALIAVISLAISVSTVSDQSLNNCRNIEKIKNIQRAPLVSYQIHLGQPDTVGYAYYKEHPNELFAAKRQLTNQLIGLRPSKC